jgi:hypothetical protein
MMIMVHIYYLSRMWHFLYKDMFYDNTQAEILDIIHKISDQEEWYINMLLTVYSLREPEVGLM